jgi:hypothetical protein
MHAVVIVSEVPHTVTVTVTVTVTITVTVTVTVTVPAYSVSATGDWGVSDPQYRCLCRWVCRGTG